MKNLLRILLPSAIVLSSFTPLWTHMIVKKTGFEVVSEALRVIWGTQDKDG